MSHIIRLREPWEPVDGGLRRRFGRPTNLTNERVWVTCENMNGTVQLNGEALGDAPGRFEVTDRLQARNVLEVAGRVGEVAIVISESEPEASAKYDVATQGPASPRR